MDSDTSLLQMYEAKSRELEASEGQWAEWFSLLAQFTENYRVEMEDGKAFYPLVPVEGLRGGVPTVPSTMAEVMEEFRRLLPNGIQPTSGRFMGYVPGGGIPTAAVGDFLAALTNRYSGAYFACPGAAELHNQVVRWLVEMVGMPQGTWGTLQSGGSLAILTAIVAARDSLSPEEMSKAVIYQTTEAHHALDKAIGIAGLSRLPRRHIAMDGEFRMSPADLSRAVKEDLAKGLKPWLLCANAGTVNSGAIDPLLELSKISKSHSMWFHVDAAYGGFFVLTEAGKKLLNGIQYADSLILDPHKGLFLPYGCGAVLVRDGEQLRSSFSFAPDYMQDINDRNHLSPTDFSPELTRHFRALRLWVSLKVHGLSRFQSALSEKLLLAQWLHQQLSLVPGVVVGPTPQLSCVTFRLADGDSGTRGVLERILARGRVHLSSTKLEGEYFIRICVLCFRTHHREVQEALSEILRAIKEK